MVEFAIVCTVSASAESMPNEPERKINNSGTITTAAPIDPNQAPSCLPKTNVNTKATTAIINAKINCDSIPFLLLFF